MAFEKAKVLKAAEKFLSQGKINAAIKEYRQIVDHDPNDLTTLNMLGDLYVRANKKEEAISCFERIAQHYSTQEFNLKAIAMYKKIERLRPRDPDIARKLGDLYASQALVVDARAQYLIVADAYTRAGDNKKALEILHRIADLDPNNTEIRIKLADGYLKESMRREAAGAYAQAANRLHQIGSHDRALDAYTRAMQLVPDDLEVLKGLLEAHIARGTADEAAEILEQAAQHNQSPQLVSMLARAHLEADDPQGAERATAILMAQDPSNYVQYLPVASLYLKAGAIDDTVRILNSIIERMLAGREEKYLLDMVTQVLERNPDHLGALRMLVRIYWWQRDMESLRTALERMVDSAQASQAPDEERYALTQLIRLAPDEKRYLDRLMELGGVQDEPADDLPPIVDDALQFETFGESETTGSEASPVQTPAEVFSFESTQSATPTFTDPNASFADLGDEATETSSEFQMVDFAEVTPAEVQPDVAEQQSESDRINAMMRQELESVDFYIAQGYTDIAIDTLDMLERQFGSQPEIRVRREKLMAGAAEPEVPAVFEFGGADEISDAKVDEATSVEGAISFADIAEEGDGPHPSVSTPHISGAPASTTKVGGTSATGIDSGLAELFEEFRAAEEDEIGDKADYETHYNMGTAYKEMDLLDEAIQEFQVAATTVKPGDGTSRYLQCCNMLGHCFMQKEMVDAAIMWFKKGLAAPGHTEDEYQALRYELASAYEQQGDLKQAKHIYTEIYGIDVSYREVADKLRELSGKSKAT